MLASKLMVSLKGKTKTLMMFELTEKELHRTDRIDYRKSGNKRPKLFLSNSHVTIPYERFL